MAAVTAEDEAIATLVDRFYDRARKDPLLAPIFADTITDWPDHLARIRAFWARHLIDDSSLGAAQGKEGGGHGSNHGSNGGSSQGGGGNFFMMHAVLPVERAHFDRWMALFAETVAEVLPPHLQQRALDRARHTSASLTAGMFTVPGHRFGGPVG